jgi:hypothetical protein
MGHVVVFSLRLWHRSVDVVVGDQVHLARWVTLANRPRWRRGRRSGATAPSRD